MAGYVQQLSIRPADTFSHRRQLWSAGFSAVERDITNQLGDFGTVLHLDHLDGPQLVAGCSYWLTAEGPSTQYDYHLWSVNGTGKTGNIAYTVNGGSWLTYSIGEPTLGMKVGVVPEPSTLTLLGIGGGAVALGWWRWRRLT